MGAAAIWFVAHPQPVPVPPAPAVGADTISDDSVRALSDDSSAISAPFSRLPARGVPAALVPKGRLFRSIEERARAGERIAVTITAYCLQGRTRRGNLVREGIIAVDRALFPLGREVDLFVGRRSLGRYLADDTGSAITGGRIDVWMEDCAEARRFGRRRGYAQLVRRTR